MVEIGKVEADFALARSRNFDQPSTKDEAVDGIVERDAADEIEHDIGAPAVGGLARLGRQVLGSDDQRLLNGHTLRGGQQALTVTPPVPPAGWAFFEAFREGN